MELVLLFIVLIILVYFVIFFKIINEPRFSPMGRWPSIYEQYQERKDESKAEYKEEYAGIVAVKNYRWSSEKEMNILNGWPTLVTRKKYVTYRRSPNTNMQWVFHKERFEKTQSS